MKNLLARFVRPSPALLLGMIVLFVALTGTAVATNSAALKLITGEQIKNGSITGLDVKNKSLTPKDFRGSVRGPRGLAGTAGAAGAVGAAGAKGDTGAPGQDLVSTSTLTPGQTLTGVFIAAGGSSSSGYTTTNWQFHPRLPANLDGSHAIFQAPSTTSVNCPAIDTAAPGYLCVYANQFVNMTFNSFNDTEGLVGVNRNGALLFFGVSGVSSYVTGRWAVRAPLSSTGAGTGSRVAPPSPK